MILIGLFDQTGIYTGVKIAVNFRIYVSVFTSAYSLCCSYYFGFALYLSTEAVKSQGSVIEK